MTKLCETCTEREAINERQTERYDLPLVLSVIAEHAEADGWAHRSVDEIAEEIGLYSLDVGHLLVMLEDRHELVIVRVPRDSRLYLRKN